MEIVVNDLRALMDCARAALNMESVVDRPLAVTGLQHAGLTSFAVTVFTAFATLGRDRSVP
jgi:hypothetical protein